MNQKFKYAKFYIINTGITMFHYWKMCRFNLSKQEPKIEGVYKSGREFIYLLHNGQFYIKREKSQIHDVVILECNDTIAKGNWILFKNGVIKFTNDKNFQKISYNIKQEQKYSGDTIYFQINLPLLDSVFLEKFRYTLSFQYGGDIESGNRLIKVAKQNYDYKSLGLVIHDLYPNCEENRKSYQRLYFRIIDDYIIYKDSNYFTVTLNNFNPCFVEQMDLDNEFLYIDRGNINWRGSIYKKISR